MQGPELEGLEALLYQMEVAAEAARLQLTSLGANFRVFSIWLLRLADSLQVPCCPVLSCVTHGPSTLNPAGAPCSCTASPVTPLLTDVQRLMRS